MTRSTELSRLSTLLAQDQRELDRLRLYMSNVEFSALLRFLKRRKSEYAEELEARIL